MSPLTIVNGTLLIDGALRRSSLTMSGAKLVADAAPESRTFDASGLLVLPGIVDVHGDAFERQIMPRPGVSFETDLALLETDRQLIANGITTAYHGITVSWEPGLRSAASAARLVEDLGRLRERLLCDTRLHLRWETFALDAQEQIASWLQLVPAPILAFNDHTTECMRVEATPRRVARWSERSGLSGDAYLALLKTTWERNDDVPQAISALAAEAARHGVVVLAHDERSSAERKRYRALGAVTSEFPMNTETAGAARAAGEHTVFGAPNVVRGGSHNNAMNATEAVGNDLCSVLASDYYYPAPLIAPFVLAERGVLPLARAWALVSKNPAEVARLDDRGELRPGLRADVIVVDATHRERPSVVASFVAGRCVYQRGDDRWRQSLETPNP